MKNCVFFALLVGGLVLAIIVIAKIPFLGVVLATLGLGPTLLVGAIALLGILFVGSRLGL